MLCGLKDGRSRKGKWGNISFVLSEMEVEGFMMMVVICAVGCQDVTRVTPASFLSCMIGFQEQITVSMELKFGSTRICGTCNNNYYLFVVNVLFPV